MKIKAVKHGLDGKSGVLCSIAAIRHGEIESTEREEIEATQNNHEAASQCRNKEMANDPSL